MLPYLILLLGAAASAPAQLPGTARDQILRRMDDTAMHYGDLSRRIWEFAEVGYQEHRSSALLQQELTAAGFEVRANIGGMPTAFLAEWKRGTGKPVVGLLAEFDALPGLSQQAGLAERKPRAEAVAHSAGHGCGHNLFGAAVVFAAIAAKDHMSASGLDGAIRVYGTPAEEGGGGKIYMARAGVFEGTDVTLTWHPGDANRASLDSSLANISAKFTFRGTASHAASAPEKGRSALDGVMLMNHAVELLREHVPQETRLHYVITKGGAAPNIVPDLAQVYLYARHPHMTALDAIWTRVLRCAEAAALATETEVETELVSSVWDILPNDALTAMLDRSLREAGGVTYDADERAFAEKLRTTFDVAAALPLGSQSDIQPSSGSRGPGASTDSGDISWLLPSAQFTAATYVPGTPGHSWQSTACAGSSIGRKGMLVAAKTLALATLGLVADPREVELARAAFEKRRAGVVYRSRIPETNGPPLDYRK
ncbi:MAG: amidohydrolase [Bryobacteraceae bacterium]